MNQQDFPGHRRAMSAVFPAGVPRDDRSTMAGGRMPWPLAAATIGVLSLSAWLAVGYAVYWVL